MEKRQRTSSDSTNRVPQCSNSRKKHNKWRRMEKRQRTSSDSTNRVPQCSETSTYNSWKNLYQLSIDLKQFSCDQTNVSMVLAKHVISSEAKDKNLVFSPLSIHVVLALIAAGATGRTLEEILAYFKSGSVDVLGLSLSQLATQIFADGSSLGGPSLSYANGVWVDQKFALKQSFKEVAESLYQAVTEQVDFRNQAEKERKKLNRWAEEKTNGLLKEIIPPGWIKKFTALVFGNALYFKGEWYTKFQESGTKDYDFFLLNGSSTKASFMTSYYDQRISAYNGFKVLQLPYKQGDDVRRFSMYIFLPDLKDGLPSLVEAFAAEPGFLERHLPCESVEVVDFRIPKFKICFDFEANKVCKELGMRSAFSNCNLTKMVDAKLNVDSILHKSFIEVNEVGTEAAAVTFASLGKFGCKRRPPPKKKMNFVADHPFLFVIREDMTGMLLFIGQVVNPILQ